MSAWPPFRWTLVQDGEIVMHEDGLPSYLWSNPLQANVFVNYCCERYGSTKLRAVPLPWTGGGERDVDG